jgi:hypothetical protein
MAEEGNRPKRRACRYDERPSMYKDEHGEPDEVKGDTEESSDARETLIEACSDLGGADEDPDEETDVRSSLTLDSTKGECERCAEGEEEADCRRRGSRGGRDNGCVSLARGVKA